MSKQMYIELKPDISAMVIEFLRKIPCIFQSRYRDPIGPLSKLSYLEFRCYIFWRYGYLNEWEL